MRCCLLSSGFFAALCDNLEHLRFTRQCCDTNQVRWKMSTPLIILASLPSFCQKSSKLVEIWQSSDKYKFAQFFQTRCIYFIYFLIFNAVQALTSDGFRIVSDTLVGKRFALRPSVCPSVRPSAVCRMRVRNSRKESRRKYRLRSLTKPRHVAATEERVMPVSNSCIYRTAFVFKSLNLPARCMHIYEYVDSLLLMLCRTDGSR